MRMRTSLACITALVLALPEVSVAEGWLRLQTYTVAPNDFDQPLGLTVGPDGALWYTKWGADKIGRITVSGEITEYALPSCAPYRCAPAGITAGPDGALWFVEGDAGRIGRITTSGVITEYELPNYGGGPRWITAGPDGALWFTEYDFGNKIGRITTDGVITEYPLPYCGWLWGNCRPFGITAGPDGALWFTMQSGRIGRITTDGVITQYLLPDRESAPFLITTGPDGALWFSGERPGRITTDGAITQFPILAPGLDAWGGIVSGPDGALWIAGSLDRLYRITTSFQMSSYSRPQASSHAYGLIVGPDGNVWFTAYPGQIARFTACGLGLDARFSNSALDLTFVLGVTQRDLRGFCEIGSPHWTISATTSSLRRELWFKSRACNQRYFQLWSGSAYCTRPAGAKYVKRQTFAA